MELDLQDRVNALLRRSLVVQKTRGVATTDLEIASVIESINISLALMPRVSLYFGHLARNGLIKTVADEVKALAAVRASVNDLGNQTYAIRNTKSLERAATALLELEQQGRVDPSSGSFKNFESSLDEFIQKQLSKNVRRVGTKELVRPGGEAQASLPSEFEELKACHERTKNALYWLATGVKDFVASNLTGNVGVTTAYRSRKDIEDILKGLAADTSGSNSRDYLLRLIAARQALRAISAPQSPFLDKVSTEFGLPDGQVLFGNTIDPIEAYVVTTSAPWDLSAAATMSITVDGVTVVSQFPAQTADLAEKAFLLTPPLPWPILVPTNYHLFLKVDGVSIRIPVNISGADVSMTRDDLINKVNTYGQGLVFAAAFPKSDSQRVALYCSGESLAVMSSMIESSPDSTIGDSVRWTRSCHGYFGLTISTAIAGQFSAEVAAYCIEELFADLGVVCSVGQDATITITAPAPAQSLSASLPPPMWVGDLGSTAVASKFRFLDEAGGIQAPATLVDRGDYLSLESGKVPIATIDEDTITLAAPVPWRDDAFSISIVSCLVPMWQQLQTELDAFLGTWLRSGLQDNLDKVDRAIAPLYGAPSKARRNEALQSLQVLEDLLLSLQTVLDAGPLPEGGAVEEESVAMGIIQTLSERKLDRAVDLLLSCRLVDMLKLTPNTASYAGSLLAAASAVAQADIRWPDRAKDEGMRPSAVNRSADAR